MARVVLLSSLSTGRCFTLAPTEGDPAAGAGTQEGGAAPAGQGGVRQGKTILGPDAVWKVLGPASGEGAAATVEAESAAGERRSFPAVAHVVEQPRQGYDRLVERARGRL